MTLDEIIDPILRQVENNKMTEPEAQVAIEQALIKHNRADALYYIFVTLRVLMQQKAEGIQPDSGLIM